MFGREREGAAPAARARAAGAGMPPTRPLFFVERSPTAGSPAALAGLRAGDAVLSFGDAVTIDDVSNVLRSAKIEARVMGRNGVVHDRIVKPRVYDPSKPNSLLGCQITDVCPARFTPHPALRGLVPRDAEPAELAPAPEPIRSSNVVESVDFLRQLTKPKWHDEPAEADDTDESDAVENDAPAVDAGGPSDTPLRAELASEPGASVVDGTPATAHKVRAAGINWADLGYVQIRWRSRCSLLTASLLNLAHGCAFLAAPSLGSKAAAVIEAFHTDLWRLASAACVGDPEVVSEEVELRRRLEAVGVYEAAFDEKTADASLTFSAFVRLALIVSTLELLLTFGGLALAILPSDLDRSSLDRACLGPTAPCANAERLVLGCHRCAQRMRCVLSVLYPPAALILWLLLAGATMYCLAFRLEADDLLRRYWQCLEPLERHDAAADPKWGGSRVFESVGAVAIVCASADLSAVFSLFAACSLIGWRAVLRASMMVFGVLSAIGGGLLASIGWVLLREADESGAAFTGIAAQGLLVLGGATCPLGILGALAAKREQTLLLQLHAALLAALSLALATLCVLLLVGGAETLRPSLERLVGDAPERMDNGVDQVVDVLQTHRISLSAASVLGLFLLAMNGTMAVGLRWILTGRIDLNDSHEYERVRGSIAPAVDDGIYVIEGEEEYDEPWPAEWSRRQASEHARREKPIRAMGAAPEAEQSQAETCGESARKVGGNVACSFAKGRRE